MQLTPEQQAIIAHRGNLKINAVAGSGKTTTLLEYAKARPKRERMLYLAFNKSVKLEAQRKFAENGLPNVQVETAHSLAFKHIMRGRYYDLVNGYKTHEIKDILNIPPLGDTGGEYIIANHVRKFAAYFCNSTARKVSELDYESIITDAKAKAFARHYDEQILHNTRLLLAKMYKGEIGITHDFYLKQFQLSNPKLGHQTLLFDEGQDASPAMLDVFLKQQATKVIVGDTHQQIYGWRHAVNSLEQVDFPELQLSTSFRFDADIALLAMKFLAWKKLFTKVNPLYIKGVGVSQASDSHAVLARTNLSLLNKAIELVFDRNEVKDIFFEGNLNSYTYAEDGASVYDVLNLYNGNSHMIRDKLIQSMGSFAELEEYVEKTEDAELSMLIEMVMKYRNDLPHLIKGLKEYHLENDKRQEAEVIFSTVHRCKGMEYDTVTLAKDFITEAKIQQILKESKQKSLDINKLAEEVNVLYVAVTRTKNQLNIPVQLRPDQKTINWVDTFDDWDDLNTRKSRRDKLNMGDLMPELPFEKTIERVRKKYPNSRKRWSPWEDKELRWLVKEQKSLAFMADFFQRKENAIQTRIAQLGLKTEEEF